MIWRLSSAPVATAIFAFAMVYAGVIDLTTMRIRNGLVLALLAAYVAPGATCRFHGREIALSAAIAAGLLVVGFVFFARGWMGGGDAKLLAVTALWLGFDHAPAFLVYTALFGGALTFAILQLRLVGLPAFLGSEPWIARLQIGPDRHPLRSRHHACRPDRVPQTRWFASLSRAPFHGVSPRCSASSSFSWRSSPAAVPPGSPLRCGANRSLRSPSRRRHPLRRATCWSPRPTSRRARPSPRKACGGSPGRKAPRCPPISVARPARRDRRAWSARWCAAR